MATRLIRPLLESVVCSGGGGVPVVRDEAGLLRGVEAVVDKDLTRAVLADALGADALLVLTDVPAVIATSAHRSSDRSPWTTPMTLRAERFAAGSMASRFDAVCTFVEHTGGMAAIGALDDACAIVEGSAGTVVTPSVEYRDQSCVVRRAARLIASRPRDLDRVAGR